MKFVAVFILITFIIVAQAAILENKWIEFKTTYQKSYSGPNDEQYRFKVFQENAKLIEEHNKKFEEGLVTYTMAINKFADMTQEEFFNILATNAANKPQITFDSTYRQPLNIKLPESVDWRLNGSVTPVKDQGNCGSCWAFSATGSLEGQNQIQNRKLISLSEQQLVDCSIFYGNYGCAGGLMDNVFEYVRDNGITTEKNYPYKGIDGNCRYKRSDSVLTCSGYVSIKEENEYDLKSAVATVGPVSVAIDASNFAFYEGGIYTDYFCSKYNLNHGVLAVGYGSQSGKDYWIVKNSWGAAWGEHGYIRMARNINLCGIASMASYPTL